MSHEKITEQVAAYPQVDSYKILSALQIHEEGEVYYCKQEDSLYQWTDGEWIPYQEPQELVKPVNMTEYDLEKLCVNAQQPVPANEIQDELIARVNKWAETNPACYYMLYGKEISYFTLFSDFNSVKYVPSNFNFESIGYAVWYCLSNLAAEKGFYPIEEGYITNDCFNIWISYQGAPTLLCLFNYDNGVCGYGA